MWQHLRLTSLGVIAEAELELGPGFTVITGETGAGKTMVVTALGLLRGERADTGLVRHGAQRSRVEAFIDITGDEYASDMVTEAGGDVDDGVVSLGRTISAAGRSRAQAGGAAAPAALLGRLSERLVAVHGQASQHRLIQRAEQRAALDAFAGEALTRAYAEFEPAWESLRSLTEEIDLITAHTQERARELEMLRQGLQECERVAPRAGEDDELLAEENRLANAEALIRAAGAAHDAISAHARDAVASAVDVLAEAGGNDEELDRLSGRVSESLIELDDISVELSRYADGVDVDANRLAVVQERRAALAELQRKYGPSIEDVLAWQENAATRVLELDDDGGRLATLQARCDEARHRALDAAHRMSALRADAAKRLGDQVTAELHELSMPHARFTAEVHSRDDEELSASGLDDVWFGFAANTSGSPRTLDKGASGGELSRIMLALEVVLAGGGTVPTLIFDEVDAGIGGQAAVEVGKRLARLANTAQVLAVTHLPQVAAFADHHFRVLKNDDGQVTRSDVVELDDDGRVVELSRMLAGQQDSESARAHAAELLHTAGQNKEQDKEQRKE